MHNTFAGGIYDFARKRNIPYGRNNVLYLGRLKDAAGRCSISCAGGVLTICAAEVDCTRLKIKYPPAVL